MARPRKIRTEPNPNADFEAFVQDIMATESVSHEILASLVNEKPKYFMEVCDGTRSGWHTHVVGYLQVLSQQYPEIYERHKTPLDSWLQTFSVRRKSQRQTRKTIKDLPRFNNTLDKFIFKLEKLAGSTQDEIAARSGLNPSPLSKYRRNKPVPTIKTARLCVAKIAWHYRSTKGFTDLWISIAVELHEWLNTLRTRKSIAAESAIVVHKKSAAHDANKYNAFFSFIVSILEENTISFSGLTKQIEGLPTIAFLCKNGEKHQTEYAKRAIYILAGKFPLQYERHKEELNHWVANSTHTRKAGLRDNEIGAIARNIISNSFVENGLTERAVTNYCDVTHQQFSRFRTGNPSQQAAIMFGLELSRHASRRAWLESAGQYYDIAKKLYVRPHGLPTKAERKNIDVSLDALRRRTREGWRIAAVEAIQRAKELKSDLALETPERTIEVNSLSTSTSTRQIRTALTIARREFESETREPLPVHLHNKPGSELKAHEIAPQIKWLMELWIP